jgi:hypothetical protein
MDQSDAVIKAMASSVTWRWIKSWKGNEDIKTGLEDAAHEVARTDAIVRSIYRSSVATGLIMEAMKDISLAKTPEVAAAAIAQNNLFKLHAEAVWIHHIEFDFARAAWECVLDSQPLKL